MSSIFRKTLPFSNFLGIKIEIYIKINFTWKSSVVPVTSYIVTGSSSIFSLEVIHNCTMNDTVMVKVWNILGLISYNGCTITYIWYVLNFVCLSSIKIFRISRMPDNRSKCHQKYIFAQRVLVSWLVVEMNLSYIAI